MNEYVEHSGIEIDQRLYNFINDDAISGTGIDPDGFWSGFAEIIHDLGPRNRELLRHREQLQDLMDNWHTENRAKGFELDEYKSFLSRIGYMIKEGDDFCVSTANVDPEVTSVAGPQLVVPIMNARFALNAANARWGSLYDALYGTDAIARDDGEEINGAYIPGRGAKVIE